MLKKLTIGLTFLFLTACNNTTSTPTSQEPDISAFTSQTVSWEACDLRYLSQQIQDGIAALLADRLECATAKTPLDWGNPDLDSVDLGLLRVKASVEASRKGAIVMNPGGPGGDGLEIALSSGIQFSARNTANPADAEFKSLSEQYDIVGFSPRGTGSSLRLTCDTSKLASVAKSGEDRSAENIARQLENAKQAAQACQANPLTKYIDTDQTVRDMDLIRILLGDEKLNYLGYSYGSWLGAWYAKRFPERAGNIVLNSNLDFSKNVQQAWELQPLGFERVFKDGAAAYIARNNAFFGLGSTKEAVYQAYRSLSPELRFATTRTSGLVVPLLYSASTVASIGQVLVSAKIIESILVSQGDAATLNSVLAALPANISDEVGQTAVKIAQFYFGFPEFYAGPPQPLELGADSAVFYAIKCNDGDWNRDEQYWADIGTTQNASFPLIGGDVTNQPCAYWTEKTTQMPELPANIPPIMMVQAEFDAPTPTEGALSAFNSLPNAGLVFIENEIGHVGFPYGTGCVDIAVANYLLTGAMPTEKQTNCQAKPLPGETQVFPIEDSTSVNAVAFSTQDLTPQAVIEPAFESEWYDRIHAIVQKNTAEFLGPVR